MNETSSCVWKAGVFSMDTGGLYCNLKAANIVWRKMDCGTAVAATYRPQFGGKWRIATSMYLLLWSGFYS
jgi:hypothetical protein